MKRRKIKMDQPQGQKPALTVIIQSWWTPALAVIMLVVGFLVGYLGRPLVTKSPGGSEPLAAVTTSVPTTSGAQVSVPTSTVNPTIAAIKTRDQFLAYLVSETKHFQGDPNAAVTLIEFSDFQ
jgi:hypothetical protein